MNFYIPNEMEQIEPFWASVFIGGRSDGIELLSRKSFSYLGNSRLQNEIK